MAPTLADRVWETSTTTGMGAFTLAGAESGYRTFNNAIGTGTPCFYTIHNQDAPSEFESGIGQLSDATTLERTTVVESSNADAKVNFSAGTKDVVLAPIARRSALLASGGRLEPEHATGLVLLATATASDDATVDFTSVIDATYDEYELHILNVVPATDSVDAWIRTTTDGGSNWDAGASDYDYAGYRATSGIISEFGSSGAAQIVLNGSSAIGSDVNETGISGVLRLIRPAAAEYTQVNGAFGFAGTDNNTINSAVSGRRRSAADVDGIRFLFESGNVESGKFKLYGVV